MADKIQISELTEATAVLNSDWLAIEDENGTATKKISVENFNATATASAEAYAEAAAQSATDASGYKADAKDYKDEATIQAGNAADSATDASGYATAAQGYATEASGYVGTAYTHATNASNSASAAAEDAADAEEKALLAKSWAVGETGLRADEAVNNAKYYAGVAQAIAGGGVASFNGRGGAVTSQAHDYNAGMVDYDNTTSGLTATDTNSAIDEVKGITDTISSGLGTAAAKDSTNAVTQASTDLVESGAVYTEINTLSGAISNKQSKTLDTSLTIDGVTETTVEGALGALVTSNAAKATTTAVNNKHKVTSFEVTTSSWTQDTTSQSGTTLYKKSVSLSHVYVDSPSVEIGAASGSVLPTTAQQTAYELLQYATCDSAVPCLYLYASDIPTDAFYISVEGVD